MSAQEHQVAADKGPVRVEVVVVTGTRTAETDVSGRRIAELLQEAGHVVTGPTLVDNDEAAIQAVVRGSAAQVLILSGGTGVSGRDRTPEAIRPLLTRLLPGFGELFRFLSFQDVGSAAWLSRASAGLVGNTAVFSLPGSTQACELAVKRLILPELGHLVHQLEKDGPSLAPALMVEEPAAAPISASNQEPVTEEAPRLPEPSGKFGQLGQAAAPGVSSSQHGGEKDAGKEGKAEAEGLGLPAKGWLRAVYELRGEIIKRREDLPQNVESFAPFVDVLDGAGEVAAMKLPSGRVYGLYGWPDLKRPGSKVLAVGWGEPLCELLALHRYPSQTGLCIEESFGFTPRVSADVERIGEAVTGRAPKGPFGGMYAVQGDRIFFLRDKKVVSWDGKKEQDEGTIKQALASLVLRWSQV